MNFGKCKIFQTHNGTEFKNLELKIFLENEDIKQYFLDDYQNIINERDSEFNYDVMKCLKENINDINSRYLLLITENDSSQEIIKYILDEIQETNEIKQEKKAR